MTQPMIARIWRTSNVGALGSPGACYEWKRKGTKHHHDAPSRTVRLYSRNANDWTARLAAIAAAAEQIKASPVGRALEPQSSAPSTLSSMKARIYAISRTLDRKAGPGGSCAILRLVSRLTNTLAMVERTLCHGKPAAKAGGLLATCRSLARRRCCAAGGGPIPLFLFAEAHHGRVAAFKIIGFFKIARRTGAGIRRGRRLRPAERQELAK
jgi:hypothetical protein